MRSPGAGGPWHQLTQLVVDESLIPRDVPEANENAVQEASAGYLVARGFFFFALETVEQRVNNERRKERTRGEREPLFCDSSGRGRVTRKLPWAASMGRRSVPLRRKLRRR